MSTQKRNLGTDKTRSCSAKRKNKELWRKKSQATLWSFRRDAEQRANLEAKARASRCLPIELKYKKVRWCVLRPSWGYVWLRLEAEKENIRILRNVFEHARSRSVKILEDPVPFLVEIIKECTTKRFLEISLVRGLAFFRGQSYFKYNRLSFLSFYIISTSRAR